MSADPSRRGLACGEIVLLLAIIVVVGALLLPAIQRMRCAAARINCQNHLKTIGLGIHGYHQLHGHLPPGGMHVYPPESPRLADPFATTPEARAASWSWAYHILPHLDQIELYHHCDPNVVRSTPVKVYYCPARRPALAWEGLAKIDFAANAGTLSTGADGVIMQTPLGTLRLADITDGLSGTVLAGEKQLNLLALGRSPDDNEAYCTPGWNGDGEVYRSGAVAPAADFRSPAESVPSLAFGASHPLGFNVVFCDGSIRHVRYSVSPVIWMRACIRNDHAEYRQNNF
ncbi:MAG: DUF1559 domain-containing protein [Gemmataceae bacterium]|nr:DUF1559 domain-containing protein [Gemmata sp.]MDW8198382.1 DUF1559 domain-containing protein [Gemmataceae bacterium]